MKTIGLSREIQGFPVKFSLSSSILITCGFVLKEQVPVDEQFPMNMALY